MASLKKDTAYYHLPGLFEFYELYRVFLPLFYEHREYFYDWCDTDRSMVHPAGLCLGRRPRRVRRSRLRGDSGVAAGVRNFCPADVQQLSAAGGAISRTGNVMTCVPCLRKVGIKETV